MAGQEKTEKATPKKRRDARNKEGNVLQSKEINTAISVLGIFCTMAIFVKYMIAFIQNAMTFFLSRIGETKTVNNEFFSEIALNVVKYVVIAVGPLLVAALFLGVLPSMFQTKGLFTMKPLKPKFSKLNPITGMKKFFSATSFVNVLKGIVTIAAIVTVVYFRIMSLLPQFSKLPDMEITQGLVFIGSNIFSIVVNIVIIFAFVSALDYIFQWWQYEKKLKMSKQEVKDEYKQIEGDPKIKAKIKQKQREIAQSRMMQEVPGADVVVRNPTHYAVALRYDAGTSFAAPKVIAKGQDYIALKIIAIAEEHEIAIVEDRPLARSLHDAVEVGREIPHTLYTAVAGIFAELESVRQKINIE